MFFNLKLLGQGKPPTAVRICLRRQKVIVVLVQRRVRYARPCGDGKGLDDGSERAPLTHPGVASLADPHYRRR